MRWWRSEDGAGTSVSLVGTAAATAATLVVIIAAGPKVAASVVGGVEQALGGGGAGAAPDAAADAMAPSAGAPDPAGGPAVQPAGAPATEQVALVVPVDAAGGALAPPAAVLQAGGTASPQPGAAVDALSEALSEAGPLVDALDLTAVAPALAAAAPLVDANPPAIDAAAPTGDSVGFTSDAAALAEVLGLDRLDGLDALGATEPSPAVDLGSAAPTAGAEMPADTGPTGLTALEQRYGGALIAGPMEIGAQQAAATETRYLSSAGTDLLAQAVSESAVVGYVRLPDGTYSAVVGGKEDRPASWTERDFGTDFAQIGWKLDPSTAEGEPVYLPVWEEGRGPKTIPLSPVGTAEAPVSDTDLSQPGTVYPIGDPFTAAFISTALNTPISFFLQKPGPNRILNSVLSGAGGALGGSAAPLAASYEGIVPDTNLQYCSDYGCWKAGESQVDLGKLAPSLATAIALGAPFGWAAKGPVGAALTSTGSIAGTLSGSLIPAPKWAPDVSSPQALAAAEPDPLSGPGGAVATTNQGTLTEGVDTEDLVQAGLTTGAANLGIGFVTTGNVPASLVGGGTGVIGGSLGVLNNPVVFFEPNAADDYETLAIRQARLAELERVVPLLGSPGQVGLDVSPEEAAALREELTALRAQERTLPGVQFSSYTREQERQFREQESLLVTRVQQLQERERAESLLPSPGQVGVDLGPEEEAQLREELTSLQQQDPEAALARLRAENQAARTSAGAPGKATIARVFSDPAGRNDVYAVKQGSLPVGPDGRPVTGLFQIIDGQVVPLTGSPNAEGFTLPELTADYDLGFSDDTTLTPYQLPRDPSLYEVPEGEFGVSDWVFDDGSVVNGVPTTLLRPTNVPEGGLIDTWVLGDKDPVTNEYNYESTITIPGVSGEDALDRVRETDFAPVPVPATPPPAPTPQSGVAPPNLNASAGDPVLDTAAFTGDTVATPLLPTAPLPSGDYSVTGWTLEGEQHTISVTDPMTVDPAIVLPPMTQADPVALPDFTAVTPPAPALVPDAAAVQPAVVPPPLTLPDVALPADVFTDLDLGGLDFGIAEDLTFDTTGFTLDDLGSGGLDLSGPLDFSTTDFDFGF